jgi:hypothetical protein
VAAGKYLEEAVGNLRATDNRYSEFDLRAADNRYSEFDLEGTVDLVVGIRWAAGMTWQVVGNLKTVRWVDFGIAKEGILETKQGFIDWP